jgi:hypothetical protein
MAALACLGYFFTSLKKQCFTRMVKQIGHVYNTYMTLPIMTLLVMSLLIMTLLIMSVLIITLLRMTLVIMTLL